MYVPRRRDQSRSAVLAAAAGIALGLCAVAAVLAVCGYDAQSLGQHRGDLLTATALSYDNENSDSVKIASGIAKAQKNPAKKAAFKLPSDQAKLLKMATAEQGGKGSAGGKKAAFKLPSDQAKLLKMAKAEQAGKGSAGGKKAAFKLPSDQAALLKQAQKEQKTEMKVAKKLAKGDKKKAKL